MEGAAGEADTWEAAMDGGVGQARRGGEAGGEELRGEEEVGGGQAGHTEQGNVMMEERAEGSPSPAWEGTAVEQEREQMERIRQLDMEELQVEEASSESSEGVSESDHLLGSFAGGSGGSIEDGYEAGSGAAVTFDMTLPTLHTYLGEVDDVAAGGRAYAEGGALLTLPVFYYEGIVLFPGERMPLIIQPRHKAAVERALASQESEGAHTIGIVHVRRGLSPSRVMTMVGTTAEIRQLRYLEDGSLRLVTKGRQRFQPRRVWAEPGGVYVAQVQIINDDVPPKLPSAAFGRLAAVPQIHSGKFKRFRSPTISDQGVQKSRGVFGAISQNDSKRVRAGDSSRGGTSLSASSSGRLGNGWHYLRREEGLDAGHGDDDGGDDDVGDGGDDDDEEEDDEAEAEAEAEAAAAAAEEEEERNQRRQSGSLTVGRSTIATEDAGSEEEEEEGGVGPSRRRVGDDGDGATTALPDEERRTWRRLWWQSGGMGRRELVGREGGIDRLGGMMRQGFRLFGGFGWGRVGHRRAGAGRWDYIGEEDGGGLTSRRRSGGVSRSGREEESAGRAAVRWAASEAWKLDARKNRLRPQLSAWPYWVYRLHDAYDLARRAADMLSELFTVNVADELIANPEACSFFVAKNLPLQDSIRQELLEMDGAVKRLWREIRIMEGLDLMKCRQCRAVIARKNDVFVMSTEGPISTFVNAHGCVHETMTLQRATGLELEGEPETENSWFPGYAWTIAHCARCRTHMGWRFTAVQQGLLPKFFWGIRRSQLENATRGEAC
ncbi:hypothetical protein CBR_g21950 [Chara braunii]|uniref:Protein cereblon n=1 Tax=Chara braunii TaxID=69332 RepID=A0A388L1N0_CHABU|nr:hypothetical protein CBR_g21950 [Chara braunii]|eukprot:GBG76201.1 hypothetical protein CBR_g21950 [Chara braunii]